MTTAKSAGGLSSYRRKNSPATFQSSSDRPAGPLLDAGRPPLGPASGTQRAPLGCDFGHALLQAYPGLPAKALRTSVVDHYCWHFPCFWRDVAQVHTPGESGFDYLDDLEHRDRGARTDYHRPRHLLLGERKQHSLGYVCNIYIVPHLLAVAVNVEGTATLCHSHEPRHDAVLLGHPRPIDVGEAQRHSPHPIGGVVTGQEHLTGGLGCPVRCERR